MTSYWIRRVPKSNENVLLRDRKGHTEESNENEGRDWGDAPKSQGLLAAARSQGQIPLQSFWKEPTLPTP